MQERNVPDHGTATGTGVHYKVVQARVSTILLTIIILQRRHTWYDRYDHGRTTFGQGWSAKVVQKSDKKNVDIIRSYTTCVALRSRTYAYCTACMRMRMCMSPTSGIPVRAGLQVSFPVCRDMTWVTRGVHCANHKFMIFSACTMFVLAAALLQYMY